MSGMFEWLGASDFVVNKIAKWITHVTVCEKFKWHALIVEEKKIWREKQYTNKK